MDYLKENIMFLIYFIYLFTELVFCTDNEGIYFNEYNLGITVGNTMDIFANYGDLGQETKVISTNYFDEEKTELLFYEPNISVFKNLSNKHVQSTDKSNDIFDITLCHTFDDLMRGYFENFYIEGTDTPWKVFMGDWSRQEIMESFGITNYNFYNCCFVLVRLKRIHQQISLDNERLEADSTVREDLINLDITDHVQMKQFINKFGSHFIDSYTSGDSVYQLFVFKKRAYHELVRWYNRKPSRMYSDDIRYHFSSGNLRHIGYILSTSGNKNLEEWTNTNLRDKQYFYTKSNLLSVYKDSVKLEKLSSLLENSALLGLNLKILTPLFPDNEDVFREIVDNLMKLWETNG